tara:strand:+ start:217 stop:546 length:330 start_codon:yes stop_codon:yes gene_type:complete
MIRRHIRQRDTFDVTLNVSIDTPLPFMHGREIFISEDSTVTYEAEVWLDEEGGPYRVNVKLSESNLTFFDGNFVEVELTKEEYTKAEDLAVEETEESAEEVAWEQRYDD